MSQDGLVVCLIQNLAVEVEHIPGGCASLYQPFHVGINRSLKANICKDWEDWMLNSGTLASITKLPKWNLIVEWVMKVYNNMSVEVVVNTWKQGTYT